MNRQPLSESQMIAIESILYSDWQPDIQPEGIWLDIAMERMRQAESNAQWLSRQARGLRREFAKKQ